MENAASGSAVPAKRRAARGLRRACETGGTTPCPAGRLSMGYLLKYNDFFSVYHTPATHNGRPLFFLLWA